MLRLRIDRRRLGAIAAALVGLGLAGLATRDVWMAWRWAREARASLTATEAAAIARCEDPGPAGTARLLASDAPVACSPAHVAAWVGAARTRRGFAAWLRRHEAEASPGPRWRAHVGLARWYVDAEAPVELAALLGATALTPEAREWTVRAVADGELAGRWVDPVLRLRGVATRVARGDLSNLPDVALALGAAGAAPGLLDDVDTDALFDVLERRVGPAAASDLPAPSCAPGPACAAAWAEAVRALVAAEAEGWDGGGAEIDPGPVATGQAGAPWEALWAAAGQPEDDADARRLLLAEVVAWVGGQERPDAALAAALASPYAAYGERAAGGRVTYDAARQSMRIERPEGAEFYLREEP